MGASLAGWSPPDDVETPLHKDQIRLIVGEEHFDEDIFNEMAVENDWITTAEFLLILSEFIDVDSFFVKKSIAPEEQSDIVAPAVPKKNTTRFKTSAELVQTLSRASSKKNESNSSTFRSVIGIKATAQKIKAFFAKKQIVIPTPAHPTNAPEELVPVANTKVTPKSEC